MIGGDANVCRTAWQQAEPRYHPAYGPRILQTDPRTGAMEIEFRLYLPERFGTEPQISGEFTGNHWCPLTLWDAEHSIWSFKATGVQPQMIYEFRYRDHAQRWQRITDPLAYRFAKRLDGQHYSHHAMVPDLAYAPKSPAPALRQGLTICECTLPGLLARWEAGGFFRRDLSRYSLAERILATDLITELREQGYNAVMLPLQACVADALEYNWKYSYLVTGFGGIDYDVGDWNEFKELVDAFHDAGILVIPDLVFVHAPHDASPRSIDHVVDATGQGLWVDGEPTKRRDYGTWMVNLADEMIRRQLVELVVRLLAELGLRRPLRLRRRPGLSVPGAKLAELGRNVPGRIDGRDRQARARRPADQRDLRGPEQRIRAEIRGRAVRTVGRICGGREPAGAIGESPPAWPPGGRTGDQPRLAADAVQAGDRLFPLPRRSGLRRGHCTPPARLGRRAHLPQLVLNQALKLPPGQRPADGNLLDFVADRTALIQSLTMFSCNFACLSVSDFSDRLKLGSYDDPLGWQTVWTADDHPDLRQWSKLSGLSPAAVRTRIEEHATLMQQLRRLFIAATPLDEANGSPCVDIRCIGRDLQRRALAIRRYNALNPRQSLLVLANLSVEPVEAFRFHLRGEMRGDWELLTASRRAALQDAATARYLRTDPQRRVCVDLPPHALLVYQRPPSGPSP